MTDATIIRHTRFFPDPPGANGRAGKSFVHQFSLAVVFLTVAISSIVVIEPAPVDAMTFGLFILLPAVGLVSFKPGLVGLTVLLLILSATGLHAITFVSTDFFGAFKYNLITMYLCGASVLFAAFIAKNPRDHVPLVLNAYLLAAVLTSLAALVGMLRLFPAAYDTFTLYGRASGTFKDPNVLGAFLVPALLYTVHLLVVAPMKRLPFIAAAASLVLVTILLTLSRGAWLAAILATAGFLYLRFVTTQYNSDRIKILGFMSAGLIAAAALLLIAIQTTDIGDLLRERAQLSQSYDQGPEGRFGGQVKAFDVILENPFGIGAREFTAANYHHENAHNSYLTLFMSNGWLGGFVFIILAFVSIVFGARHALKLTETQPLFLIAFVTTVVYFLEAIVIDIDHWRHFFLFLGVMWGMIASSKVVNAVPLQRNKKVVADRRPVLLRPTIVVGPIRRASRIVAKHTEGRRPQEIAPVLGLTQGCSKSEFAYAFNRPARILARDNRRGTILN